MTGLAGVKPSLRKAALSVALQSNFGFSRTSRAVVSSFRGWMSTQEEYLPALQAFLVQARFAADPGQFDRQRSNLYLRQRHYPDQPLAGIGSVSHLHSSFRAAPQSIPAHACRPVLARASGGVAGPGATVPLRQYISVLLFLIETGRQIDAPDPTCLQAACCTEVACGAVGWADVRSLPLT